MRRRFFVALSVALVFPVLLAGQAARSTPASRTGPASQPLDGIWNFATLTPVERPQQFAGRATMTPEEAAQFERQTLERTNADRRGTDAAADVAVAYNDTWYDRGSRVAWLDGRALTSLISDPPDGRMPALTPEAQRRQAARAQARRGRPADGPEDRSLAERCLLFNAGPPLLPGPYNNNIQIFQFADHVVIHNEMIHDARVVPTDGRPHAPQSVRRLLGDSIGRWEGQTLVVDTTNFSGMTSFRGSGEQLHLIERFTRKDATTLLYEFTIDDPASFTKPWSVKLPMKQSDEPIFEYACHEGNHAMEGMLRGARFDEKQTPR